MRRPEGRRAVLAGFSLVEALVATALAAAAIAGLLGVLASSSRATATIEAQTRAQALAVSLLATPDPRRATGTEDDLRWRTDLTRSSFDPDGVTVDGFRLMRFVVEVRGPRLGDGITLETERLMR
ncbi:hypothetical protein [uncultured Roseobacter sp.]|uniref:hypothetical protein n=1 Tax=uncultured Roseobacter sp. TaxID=114847 RepID=UPI0026386000|nr:hypothetical protein [uncultured Roseobacter sp.]